MDDVASRQLACAGQRSLSNFHGSVCIAFFLNRRTAATPDCTRDTVAQNQVAVRCVDDGVEVLLHEIARDDQDSRRRQSLTSSMRSSNCARVAAAIPLNPIAEIVSDAHAIPHTSASCSWLASAPVVSLSL